MTDARKFVYCLSFSMFVLGLVFSLGCDRSGESQSTDAIHRKLNRYFHVFEVGPEASPNTSFGENALKQHLAELNVKSAKEDLLYGDILQMVFANFFLGNLDDSRRDYEQVCQRIPETLNQQVELAYASYLLGEHAYCVDIAMASYDANQDDGRPLLLCVLAGQSSQELNQDQREKVSVARSLLLQGFSKMAAEFQINR